MKVPSRLILLWIYQGADNNLTRDFQFCPYKEVAGLFWKLGNLLTLPFRKNIRRESYRRSHSRRNMTQIIFVDRHGKKVNDLFLEVKNDWADGFKDEVILDYLTDENMVLDDINHPRNHKHDLTAVVSKNHCECGSINTNWLNTDGSKWVCQDCELIYP